MGFWSWLLKDMNTRDETITPPVSDVLLKALLNNEVITREKALTLPVVSGAVDFITNSVASMPVKLYKVKQGKVEEQSDDIRVKLLNGDTGDTLDAFQLKKAMVEDYLLGKGGYCYIQRDRNDVVALRYVEDQYITILKNFKPIYKDYEILVEGQSYEPYEFIKLLRNTKDGGSGTGLTTEVSKALETAYQTLIYQLSQVQAGGNKKGFLKSQRTLGQEEINALKKAWKNMYGNGQDNVVVLNNGIEFQESGASAIDMQLDQNKNTLRSEINYIFHINEHDFDLTFKEAIYPIIKAFETALNRDLLLEKEKKNYFFEFDVKEIVKASLTERYNAYKTAKETGWLSYNEIRRMENMEYVEGLDVVNVGLGAVLYDIKTHKYYTPNTDTVSDPNDGSNGENPEEAMDTMLEHHELVEAFDESGNSAERQIRFNDVHDSKTGRFGSKSGVSGLAQDQTWDEFRQNVSNKELMAEMKSMGINNMQSLRNFWVEQKMNGFTSADAHEVPKEDAINTIRENIGQNTLDGWFVNADSGYKQKLETAILNNKEVRNAGLNIAYQNYKDQTGSGASFDEFVNTELTMFRGDRGQKAVKDDVFMSFTTDKNVASGFGGNITEIKIKPINTLGSYQTTGESEYLIPTNKIRR